MAYVDWQPGMPLQAPAYLDANVLVGAIINRHRLYKSCARLLADLLVSQCRTLVSLLTVQECLWAITRISYLEMYNRPSNAHFSVSIYEKHCQGLFNRFGARFTAVGSMLESLRLAGHPIELVPIDQAMSRSVVDLTPAYMHQFQIAPADAMHLAIAQKHARIFITADRHFQAPGQSPAFNNLTIVHVAQ